MSYTKCYNSGLFICQVVSGSILYKLEKKSKEFVGEMKIFINKNPVGMKCF